MTKNYSINLTIILTIAFLVRLNIFGNSFVMDDFPFIVNWPLIRDLRNLPSFFFNYTPPPGQEGIYSPLKTLFHSISYHMFELRPFGYHLISLIIHSFGIYFVYHLSRLLTKDVRAAFVAALIFAVHPVQVEAISYITASVDMIGIVFLFASFYFYIQIQEGEFLNRRRYLLSCLFAFGAVYTHELAIALPILFLWYDFCFRKEFLHVRKTVLRLLPYFLIVLSYVGAKFLVLGGITRGSYLYGSIYLTMLVVIKAWAKYVVLCLFPLVLTHNQILSVGIYSFDPIDFDKISVLSQSLFDARTGISFLCLLSLFFLAVINFKNMRLITFCIGWFFISLLPVSNIIPSGVYFGERYLYPGMLAFGLLFGILYSRALQKQLLIKITATIILVSFLSFYVYRTWLRNADWRDEISLFESAVRANPSSALMKGDLGLIYLKNHLPFKALETIDQAIAIQSDRPVFYFSLGEVYIQTDQLYKAIEAYNQAIVLKPDYAEAYYNLAGVYAKLDKMEDATSTLEQSMNIYRSRGETETANMMQDAFKKYFLKTN